MRAIKWLSAVLIVSILTVYLGLPVGMAIVALWPARSAAGQPPRGFEQVTLTTVDGVELTAWHSPPRNGAAVILLHGAGGSKESTRRLAEDLVSRGFGVLAVDLRGHGQSGGRTNRLGWSGSTDVRAAVDYLLASAPETRLGGVGLSMGGEVLLGATAACPEIVAVVADGATRRSTGELLALPSKRSLVESFTPRVMYAAVRVMSGEHPPAPLLEEVSRAKTTSVYLIAAGEDELEVAFNERFAQVLGPRATLWVAPGVQHLGASSRYPDEYRDRVLGFMEERLLN
jgi:pimeloyl-ACP methyl ester carboxylesterase